MLWTSMRIRAQRSRLVGGRIPQYSDSDPTLGTVLWVDRLRIMSGPGHQARRLFSEHKPGGKALALSHTSGQDSIQGQRPGNNNRLAFGGLARLTAFADPRQVGQVLRSASGHLTPTDYKYLLKPRDYVFALNAKWRVSASQASADLST